MLEMNSLERRSALCRDPWQLDRIRGNNNEEMKLYWLFTQ